MSRSRLFRVYLRALAEFVRATSSDDIVLRQITKDFNEIAH